MATARDRSARARVPTGFEAGPDATLRATASALASVDDTIGIVVMVEGTSDEIAVHATAARSGLDLDQRGVVVLPIGGAHAVTQFASELASPARELLGLVDLAEASLFVDALGASNVFVSNPDLEYEITASLGQEDFEALLESQGDLRRFRTFGKQPAWADAAFLDQAHRWLRAVSGRSQLYADLAISTAPQHRLPPALVALIDRL